MRLGWYAIMTTTFCAIYSVLVYSQMHERVKLDGSHKLKAFIIHNI